MLTRRAILAAMAHLFIQPTAVDWGKGKLIRKSLRPPDYETPVALLDSFITPVEHFYVRSHLPIPAVDANAYVLRVDGEVAKPLSLTLADLKALPPVTVTTTLECAGNGRSFFEPAVAGIQWQKGAVGTARWTGVRMADVLARAGVTPAGRNVIMSAADRPLGTMPPFVRQVPIAKATHPDTILAFGMNGQTLPIVHGFPVRAIIPGWEGAYSVKWVTGLSVIDRDHDGFWVATAYRYPTRRVEPGAAVDAKDMAPLTGLVVKSLITKPADGAWLRAGRVTVAGFAWAGEQDIARVDISIDDGATWRPARLVGERARYTWRRFEFEFTALRPGSGQAPSPRSYTIRSRATDAAGNVQPEGASPWNPSGYLWNRIDSIRVAVGQPETAVPSPAVSHETAPPSSAADATLRRACLSCHDMDLIEQQRLSAAGWTREVDKMIRWGAKVSDAEKSALVEYLAARFGVR